MGRQTPILTILGTGSDVGKSITVAALCRIFYRQGLNPAPFKSQNMALNSFVTKDGGEMGRAQAYQAAAAMVEPSIHMNPILLKPMANTTAQVIVHGQPLSSMDAITYHESKIDLWPKVTESMEILKDAFDLIIIEGAGSPAEINLAENDIANLKVARHANAPILLVADIDRGGVFASIIGTLALLPEDVRKLVRGFIINKFRGDKSILDPGVKMLEEMTGLPVVGVVPYFRDIPIEEEDGQYGLAGGRNQPVGPNPIETAIIKLPYLANVTDYLSLEQDPRFHVRYVERPSDLGAPDIVILPGTRKTTHDLSWLRTQGFAAKLHDIQGQSLIIGICGGYQMLSETIIDEDKIESDCVKTEGLAFLPMTTRFDRQKTVRQTTGHIDRPGSLISVAGYEIHHGLSKIAADIMPLCQLTSDGDGCQYGDGIFIEEELVMGTYVHGFFDSDDVRSWLIALLRQDESVRPGDISCITVGDGIDRLADHFEDNLDIDFISQLIDEALTPLQRPTSLNNDQRR